MHVGVFAEAMFADDVVVALLAESVGSGLALFSAYFADDELLLLVGEGFLADHVFWHVFYGDVEEGLLF